MLDTIMKFAANVLKITMGEVRRMREELHAELVEDDARYAARTQLRHPKGSSTPLNEAADRAQQAYDRARENATKALPKMVALVLAQKVAEQLRDETAAARDRHLEDNNERLATKVHPETRELFARLFEHGVTPWHLKALSNEDVAIIADLIRWKASDARYRDTDTPWRQVLALYAERLILKAGRGTNVRKSAAGTPVRPERYTDPVYYMFNEMVDPAWGVATTPALAPVATPVVAVPVPSAPAPASAPMEPVESSGETNKRAVTANGDDTEITEAKASAMAEAIYDREDYRIGIYWPKDVVPDDYDPDKLIPALERWVGSDDNWVGAEDFLKAARKGLAREFIGEKRRAGIERLTAQLLAGEEQAVIAARRLGLLS